MTNPSFVNRVETLPPTGASDHDIVYSEINLALPQNKQQAHKMLNYKKAQWDQIEKDLTETCKQLKKYQELGFSFLILFFILGIMFFLFI
jgi:hypothetical protein